MLKYSKKHLIVYYALAAVGVLGFLMLTAFIAGDSVPVTWWGFFLLVIDVVIPVLLALVVAKWLMNKDARKTISIYEEECDPGRFIDMSEKVASRIIAPFGEWGAWYESYRSMAYGDLGIEDEGRRIFESMLKSAEVVSSKKEKADMMLFSYPSAVKFKGQKDAMWLIEEAKSAYLSDPIKYKDKLDYISSQESLNKAMGENDVERSIEILKRMREDRQNSLRVRAEAAYEEAQLLHMRGRFAEELTCLAFVVENGGKLPIANVAKTRLASLD